MRKIILTAMVLLSLVIMVSINSATAEERSVIIEMGESGQTVPFPKNSQKKQSPKGLCFFIFEHEIPDLCITF